MFDHISYFVKQLLEATNLIAFFFWFLKYYVATFLSHKYLDTGDPTMVAF